ncbi:MAG: hypothetical protein KY443_04625 [Actinobacteria bacterium]|nr:hypothetical protein [Actinomycetota bacterium]
MNRRFEIASRGLVAVVALRVALGPYRALAGQPEELFRPVWFLRPLDGMPPVGVFLAVQVVGTAAALYAAVGRRGPGRWGAFVVGWLAFLVLAGLRSSLGKILHNDVLLLLAAVPFVVTPDGDGETRSRQAVHAAMAVVAAAYFFAGLAKVRHSGLAWVTGDNMRYILTWGAVDGRAHFDGWALWVADRAWLSTLSAAGILGLELGAPVAIGVRALRPVFVGAAVGLHVATWFLLGLDYWAWIATVVVVLVDWSRVRPSAGRGREAAPPRAATG